MKNIFLKMLFIFLIPAVGMLFFTGGYVKQKISIFNEIEMEKESVKYLQVSEKLLNEIQKERGLSAGFIASKTTKFKDALQAQRILTNKALENYKNYILNINIKNKRLHQQIKKIQNKLISIRAIRMDVDKLKISVKEDIQRYTKINNCIIDSIAVLLSSPLSQERFKEIYTLYDLINLKDLVGIQRALFTNIFVNPKTYDEDMKKYILAILDKQEKYIRKFLNETSIANISAFHEIVDIDTTDKINEYKQIVLDNNIKKIKNIDSKLWWELATKRVEQFGSIVNKISKDIIKSTQKSIYNARKGLILSSIIWVIGVIGFFVSLTLLIRIVKKERKNYESLIKQKQLYNVLSKTNEHIIHDYDMDEVFKNICDVATQEIDLSLAFIGMLDQDKNIKIVASSGDKELRDYLLRLNIGTKNDKYTRLGLAGKAIVEGKNIVIDDVSKDKVSLLSTLVKRHKLHSAGAYPLTQSNIIVGVMVFYSKHLGFFDKDITGLFEKMTSYLSFGLEKEVEKRLYKLYEEELRISAYAFDSQEAMLITDKEANIIKVNNAFTKITGYTKEEVIGLNPKVLKSNYHNDEFFKSLWSELTSKGRWTGELYNYHKDGKIYPQKTTITAIKDRYNKTTHYIGQFYDISDIKQSEENLIYQARHDTLTGLPNRIVLKDRLEQAIKSAKRHKKIGALMFIDLDNFKSINDTLGHDVGDELLKQIANILVSCVREEDSVIRFGGDEFLILTSNLSMDIDDSKQKVMKIAEKIKENIDTPLYVRGYELTTTPSIGVTLFPSYSTDANDIIKQADIAMYKVKEAGKNSIEFYTPKK